MTESKLSSRENVISTSSINQRWAAMQNTEQKMDRNSLEILPTAARERQGLKKMFNMNLNAHAN